MSKTTDVLELSALRKFFDFGRRRVVTIEIFQSGIIHGWHFCGYSNNPKHPDPVDSSLVDIVDATGVNFIVLDCPRCKIHEQILLPGRLASATDEQLMDRIIEKLTKPHAAPAKLFS